MPAPDRVIVDEQSRGDLLAAPTVMEQRESLDPARQPMGCAAEPSRARAQVGAILG